VVIVTGVVEGVFEIRFGRINWHHVQAIVLPQFKPGVEFALVEQITFEIDNRHGGKEC
jgi:hypothetical protein